MMNLQGYTQAIGLQLENKSIETIMVMLFEGMILQIKKAQELFNSKEEKKAKESLIKAMKIADALMENLNYEEATETVNNLEALYYFIIKELSDAFKLEDREAKLNNAIKISNILLQPWQELAKRKSENV